MAWEDLIIPQMNPITKEQLKAAIPLASQENIDKYYEHLLSGMEKYGIDTPVRQAYFLAQIAHESGSLSAVSENLNYSAQRLLQIFPKYFKADTAASYANKPMKIANKVYGNRMGNVEPNDGFKFRGRGLIGTTGRENYYKTGKGLGIDLVANPDLLLDPKWAAHAACWFWYKFGCNDFADKKDFKGVTKRINGMYIGYADRVKHLAHTIKALNIK